MVALESASATGFSLPWIRHRCMVALESTSATGLSPWIWHLWYPRECISYGVVLALDVAYMVALMSASATGLSVTWMWHLWWNWSVHQLQDCHPGCGIYGAPGECISYRFVLALDVASMYGSSGECISNSIVILNMASMVALVSASAMGLSVPWMGI